jgi:uncharacterized protein
MLRQEWAMEKALNGLPYRPISEFYRTKFSSKVYKIPVSVAETCPNREGLKGMTTCIFCDQWGSAARLTKMDQPLSEQISHYQQIIQKRFHAENYLVYFQAYTNTFVKLQTLKNNFDTALSFPFVKGFIIGTRPDCISKSVLDMWNQYNEKTFVAVEIGAQSFFNHHLDFIKRGHTAEQTIKSIELIKKSTNVDLGIHLMFGMPNETDEEIIETARICNQLPITNVKLHNLHVLKDTPLEVIYNQKDFLPIERDLYAHRLQLFLEHLSPQIYIQRLAAYSPRWDELIAPDWTKDKMGSHQALIDHLKQNFSYQSRLFEAQSEPDREMQIALQKKSFKNV